jgi:hypothetical protein
MLQRRFSAKPWAKGGMRANKAKRSDLKATEASARDIFKASTSGGSGFPRFPVPFYFAFASAFAFSVGSLPGV